MLLRESWQGEAARESGMKDRAAAKEKLKLTGCLPDLHVHGHNDREITIRPKLNMGVIVMPRNTTYSRAA